MDHHDLGVADLRQSGRDGVTAARTAGDAPHSRKAESAGGVKDRSVTGLGADDDHGVDLYDSRDPLEDVDDERTSSGVGPDLVGPGSLAAPRRRYDDRDAQRLPARVGRGAGRGRPSTVCRGSAAVVAKIIRPAGVCSTEVTVTCTC